MKTAPAARPAESRAVVETGGGSAGGPAKPVHRDQQERGIHDSIVRVRSYGIGKRNARMFLSLIAIAIVAEA